MIKAVASKIRHFYDLVYLASDEECLKYVQSADFQKDLLVLFEHDQQEFDEPKGWKTRTLKESYLFIDFPTLWKSLSRTYQNELTPLAFLEIPEEKLVAENFMRILENI